MLKGSKRVRLFFVDIVPKMDELKRLVQKARKAVQMVEAIEGKRDLPLRRSVNQIVLDGGGKHTGNNNRWISRRDKRTYVDGKGRKVRN